MSDSLRIRGVELAYELRGTGQQDLIFVHGYSLRSTGALYQPLCELLAARFRVTLLDLRGHGGSSGVAQPFKFDELASDIVEVVAALKLRRPLYVGHSLGGLLGLRAELRSPGLFGAVIPVAPAAAGGDAASLPGVIDRAVQLHLNREAMARNFRSMYVREVPDAHLAALVESACLLTPEFNETWLRSEWPQVDISADLSRIRTPALFISGARDIIVSPDEQHRTAMALPHCKEVMFSDEGHMLPLEAPERTAREIIRFYEEEVRPGLDAPAEVLSGAGR